MGMLGGGGGMGAGSQGGGSNPNAFIGMAMGQASKLFDQQSGQGNLVSLIPYFCRSLFLFRRSCARPLGLVCVYGY